MAKRLSDANSYLAQLEAKKDKLKQKIVFEKKKLRAASRVLHAKQSRIPGEVMLRLAERGVITDEWRELVLRDLAANAAERDRQALEGTFFEIAAEAEPISRSAEFGLLAQAKRQRDSSIDR